MKVTFLSKFSGIHLTYMIVFACPCLKLLFGRCISEQQHSSGLTCKDEESDPGSGGGGGQLTL